MSSVSAGAEHCIGRGAMHKSDAGCCATNRRCTSLLFYFICIPFIYQLLKLSCGKPMRIATSTMTILFFGTRKSKCMIYINRSDAQVTMQGHCLLQQVFSCGILQIQYSIQVTKYMAC